MPQDTGERDRASVVLLARLKELERAQAEHFHRSSFLISQQSWALARIEQRLMVIESSLTQANGPESGSLSLATWLKILGGLALPLGVLLLTRDPDLARRFIFP